MQARQVCQSGRVVTPSGYGSMAKVEASMANASIEELLRRVDCLVQLCEVADTSRKPGRERRLRQAVEDAHMSAFSGSAPAVAAALSALDLLSLELCED